MIIACSVPDAAHSDDKEKSLLSLIAVALLHVRPLNYRTIVNECTFEKCLFHADLIQCKCNHFEERKSEQIELRAPTSLVSEAGPHLPLTQLIVCG